MLFKNSTRPSRSKTSSFIFGWLTKALAKTAHQPPLPGIQPAGFETPRAHEHKSRQEAYAEAGKRRTPQRAKTV